MPCIDDMLDQLGGKKIFTTLDARSGYWQIKMGAGSQEKTAFSTHDGLYEFGSCLLECVMGPQLFSVSCNMLYEGLVSFVMSILMI